MKTIVFLFRKEVRFFPELLGCSLEAGGEGK